MADKDLYVVIAEMLRKQDQQSEILERIDSTLNEFMELSLKQFEQQANFNDNIVASLGKFTDIQEKLIAGQGLMVSQLDTMNSTQEMLANSQGKLAELLDKSMGEIVTRLSRIEDKLL